MRSNGVRSTISLPSACTFHTTSKLGRRSARCSGLGSGKNKSTTRVPMGETVINGGAEPALAAA